MRKDINIQNELQEISSVVAQIPNCNVYTIPDGYFENNNMSFNTIVGSLKENKSTEGYDVPEGYFDTLAERITENISRMEKDKAPEETSVILDSLRNINVYQTDKNYFERLPDILKEKTLNEAKIVSIHKRPALLKYMAAAAITGLLGTGIYVFYSKQEKKNSEFALVLSEASQIIKNNNLDNEIEQLKEEEIINYLAVNGHDVKAALVAASSEESQLPEPDDYIYDEQTLDNFLEQQNISKLNSNKN